MTMIPVELQARVRLRLEESEPGIWSDAMIDEAILASLEEYNNLLPLQERVSVDHPGGAGPLTLPGETGDVVRVVLGSTGRVLPRRMRASGSPTGEELSWEWFAGALHFSQPLDAQVLIVWRLRPHEVDEVSSADRGLLVLGGVWRALQQHSVQQLRRGVMSSSHETSRAAEREYRKTFDARRRRLRAHVMGMG